MEPNKFLGYKRLWKQYRFYFKFYSLHSKETQNYSLDK